jgi:hypothetical protein
VQPWGPDRGRQATLISEHRTAAEAFADIDRLIARMIRTGARADAVELLVINANGTVVQRLAVTDPQPPHPGEPRIRYNSAE